jgi:nucleotide-binding universal stress UspA family protein
MYQKILFCTDLYPSSDYAFATALDMVEQSGARLIVLHVLESAHRYSGHFITYDGSVWASEGVVEKLKANLKKYYLARVDESRHERLSFQVRAGVPWLEILRTARREKTDVIVLGSYTDYGPESGIEVSPHLGGNAQKVSLKARCLVSIVTSPKQQQTMVGDEAGNR